MSRSAYKRGEDSPRARLTEDKVTEIRHRYATGEWSTEALARDFGISQTTIYFVVTGSTWRHVGGPIHVPDKYTELMDREVQHIPSSVQQFDPVDPSLADLKAHRDNLEAELTATKRGIAAKTIIAEAPAFYVKMAAALIEAAENGDSLARAKVMAAIISVVTWNDAWDDYGPNEALVGWEPSEDNADMEDSTMEWLNKTGEAIMGKEPERTWRKPWPKEST